MSARAVQIDAADVAALYGQGLSLQQIADRIGCSRTTVAVVLAKAGVAQRSRREAMRLVWDEPGRRAQMRETMLAVYARTGTGIAVVPPVPRWVPGDLVDDFIDHARLWGEEAAASHCRRLKREAEACL